jgi:uncharacterized membrane protein
MVKSRIEAFSDCVISILITIMVLELKIPRGSDWAALRPLVPVFLSYILSFIYLGIYWNNHHHLFQVVQKVNGRVLWANLHLLFWLSLIPFVTGWTGVNKFDALPVALYGVVLFFAAIAYTILSFTLISHHGNQSTLAIAIGKDFKGKVSLSIYALGILLSFFNSWFAFALYVFVAILWLIPHTSIEEALL